MSIKVVFVDVDGTLTDGQFIISSNNDISKSFYTRDFHSLMMLQNSDIFVVIITSSFDDVIVAKCKELPPDAQKKLFIYQDVVDKKEKVRNILEKWNILECESAFIGDAWNDLEVMEYLKERGGYIGCPKDAVEEVLEEAEFVSSYNGGKGAVSEFCMNIMDINKSSSE